MRQADQIGSIIVSAVTQVDPAVPAGSTRALSERRPLGDRGFQVLALASGLLVLVILVLIAVSTTQQASSWFSTEGLKIFYEQLEPHGQPVRRAGLHLRHDHHRGSSRS